MISWYQSSIVILITVPIVLSRYVDISPRRSTSKYGENRDDDENVSLFPKSHLRLHNRPPRVLHTKEGSNEVLECQAGGSPIPRIYWMKDGTLISQIDLSDELELQTTAEINNRRLNIGSTISKLYLDCMSVGDEAEYSCVAETANHRESTTTRITVASSSEKRCQDKTLFGQAPRILSWTKTALEEQGQDIKVICRVDGFPKPTIKWLDPIEREITAGGNMKYHISSNGDLIIRNLKWSDMGNYACMAENAHGTAKAEVFVYPSTPEP